MNEWIAFLEMIRKPDLPTPPGGFGLERAERDWRVNLDWYQRVGGDWQWTDRLKRTTSQWLEYVESQTLETWIASIEGEECGFFELVREKDEVRIAMFGLLPGFIGKGLGAALLGAALERAWTGGTRRVFLDTCGKDHPNALPNYLRHGFRIIRTEFADGYGMG